MTACIDAATAATAADEAEFAAFVQRHGAGLLRAVRRRVGSAEDAQDVTQEALLRTWRRRHDHADDTHRRNFAHFVADRLVIDLHRSKDHQVEARPEFADDVLGSAPSAADLYVRAEDRARVTAALAALPDDQRALLVDADIDELSLDELRARYGATAEVLRYRRFRARRALRRQLERAGAPAFVPLLLRRVAWRNAWHRLQDAAWLPTGAQAAVVVLTTIGMVTGPFTGGAAVPPAHADTPPAAVAALGSGARARDVHPSVREVGAGRATAARPATPGVPAPARAARSEPAEVPAAPVVPGGPNVCIEGTCLPGGDADPHRAGDHVVVHVPTVGDVNATEDTAPVCRLLPAQSLADCRAEGDQYYASPPPPPGTD